MKTIKTILKILLVLQIISCAISSMKLSLDALIPRTMILLIISLSYWIQMVPSVKYKDAMEQVSEAHYEYLMNAIRVNPGKNSGKYRLQQIVIFGSIFISIALIVYIVLFLVYIDKYLTALMFRFLKPSRIIGMLVLVGGCWLLIDRRIKAKRKKEKLFSEKHISQTGLIIQNILFSMITFIY